MSSSHSEEDADLQTRVRMHMNESEDRRLQRPPCIKNCLVMLGIHEPRVKGTRYISFPTFRSLRLRQLHRSDRLVSFNVTSTRANSRNGTLECPWAGIRSFLTQRPSGGGRGDPRGGA